MPSLPKSIYQWSIENVSYWMTENGFDEETPTFKGNFTLLLKLLNFQTTFGVL